MERMAVLAECYGSQLRNRHDESPGKPGLSSIMLSRVWFVCHRRGIGMLVVIGVFN